MNDLNTNLSLTTPVESLGGVGSVRGRALREMGIRCVADLLLHLPTRYEQELGEKSVADASRDVGSEHQSSANLSIRGEVLNVRVTRSRRQRFEAQVHDDTGTVLLTWFNASWLRNKIHPGMFIRAWGKAKRFGDYLQLVNPSWEQVSIDDEIHDRGERLRPIYPASESISSALLDRIISSILQPTLSLIDDHLDDAFRRERSLPPLADAYQMMHAPEHADDVVRSRRRLAYDELLFLQLGVMLKRLHRRKAWSAVPLKWNDAIDRHIRERIPFNLTASQDVVVREIAADLRQSSPMNRLLQGDVGAGKTVVAMYAMLMAAASGSQAALLAPTELLAEQHFSTMTDLLQGSRLRIELITGTLPAAKRREVTAAIEAGEVGLIVGTHALLSESVRFKELAIAVIDEQHRFGVHQRAVLRTRSDDTQLAAHVLVMTATPIPRTLSITLFGDLDVSTIRGLPPGRMPIATRLMPQARSDEVYQFVARRVRRGEQAYIVVPVIDEGDSGLKDVHTHLDELRRTHFRGLRLAAMHGRLSRAERESIMKDFRLGSIDALIATTVIEVGVDVSNATMMIIEHAERFGLAQLHQLRGRVGRGSKRSVCVLIGDPTTGESVARLEAIRRSNDGFVIAEKDLEIRGPGELFGTRQSGVAPFRVAEIPKDLRLLEMARRDAQSIIATNPALEGPELELLRRRLRKAHGDSIGLGDVA